MSPTQSPGSIQRTLTLFTKYSSRTTSFRPIIMTNTHSKDDRRDRESGRHRSGNNNNNRNSRPNDRETQISKALSSILRHRAKEIGLSMDERGFVRVDELLSHHKFKSMKLTLTELQSIVSSNAKKRFELSLSPVPSSSSSSQSDTLATYLIRATQGHSITGLDISALLVPVLPEDDDFPAQVVHGTYPAKWNLILASGGLKPMGRTHVHFAVGLPGEIAPPPPPLPQSASSAADAEEQQDERDGGEDADADGVKPTADAAPVISGMRASASVLVWVDVQKAIDGGVKWWRSKNGVILTEGLVGEGSGEGPMLPLRFVSRVVRRGDGSVIWKNEEGV